MAFSVKIIRDSFRRTNTISEQLTDKFYETLFQNHPEAKGLFHKVDIAKQQQLLYNSLDFIVANLDNPDRLSEYLQNLGERHVTYGAEEEHFAWVADALLSSLKFYFEDEWTDELETNWSAAIKTIADYMIIGMRAKLNNVVPMKEESSNSEGSNNSELGIEIPQLVKDEIRLAVKKAIADAIQQEFRAILKEELDNLASSDEVKAIVKSLKGAA
ncbi:globin domain-containing protein [Pseudobacteriovorax antillogorgiicola]|uniref:Hemoglobin-like flavoprotein n=1 Tax=Pseudobacteriovorax antillogorgiicola TaxID=1513793 RepID=A0A1Y6BM38_9BACT|nr:globin domain-containing protein [Pseudobacteriovorax antillogorgiicola]TCS54507.1 hemoglobin-like flavoprotein [Pseudobacteriovorax antillogorgiicola]SMF18974.1 Hemoglobin-like flavoprotein [Pseudobacteriovorax antillogorgiicola]